MVLLTSAIRLFKCRSLGITSRRGFCAVPLPNRSVIRVEGNTSSDFLQGLMTNDILHLSHNEPGNSMYALFLNQKGRVLFDTFIMRTGPGDYLIDCDSEISERFIKHLKIFKLRQKINIEKQEDSKIIAIFDPTSNIDMVPEKFSSTIYYRDTRAKGMGFRAILSSGDELSSVSGNESDYKSLRYNLGVIEGSREIQAEKALPLEHNVDYMNGVSFHKGCYIGQELTARTYHTGVIRKRIMPIELSNDLSIAQDEEEGKILNESGKKVGTIHGLQGKVGLALCRIDDCTTSKLTINDDIEVKVKVPSWWPSKV